MKTIHSWTLSVQRLVVCAVAVFALIAAQASAQFTPGNLVVVRMGDGAAALSAAAAAVFLDEYTTTGTFVQTVALPTGAGNALTNAGSATSEGFLNLSTNGLYLVQGGYRAIPGTAGVVATTSTTNPRVVGRTEVSTGTIDTTTVLSADTSYSTANIRSATSDNGAQFWTAGSATNGGVRYVASLGATSSTQITAAPTNTRVVTIFGTQLYVSTAATPFIGVSTVGPPGPSGASGQTTTILPGFPATTSGSSNYDYFFADANTVYVADDAGAGIGGIQKWTFNGSTWSLAYTLVSSPFVSFRGLTGRVTAGVATLWATNSSASNNKIVTVTDTGSGSAVTDLTTPALAGTNRAFRGIRYIPCTTIFYADADGDTYGNPAVTTLACAAGGGYVANNTDCDDSDASINPGATEVCDGLDNDCDGFTDEGVLSTFYADTDGDTYGDPANTTLACAAGGGYVADNTDCDDSDASINPGATEVCDGLDNDCDGFTDEGVQSTFYADADGDTYGNPASTTLACSAGGGYVADNTDCNDANAAINPGALEVCDGTDNDCDGFTDEGTLSVFYADADGDTYGNPASTTLACSAGGGYVADNTDCNDANAAINPGATEVCDGTDNDCDGFTDEGTLSVFYADADGDTYGNAASTTLACAAGGGYVADSTDCDDGNAAINPGATEVCDGLDNDCDGFTDEGVQSTFYADADGDTYGNPASTTLACSAGGGYVANNTDCNDGDAAINPGATEVCDGLDNDCDGFTDEGVQSTFYADADGDTYGDAASTTLACAAGGGYVADNTDCNDADASINPGATEVCDGLDNDCDGFTDEGVQSTFYADTDGDTYGDPANTTLACSAPGGYVADNTDCDDTNAAINPGATEVCNGIDDNCVGGVDETCPSNDACGDATAISDGSITGSNAGAATEITDTSCGAVVHDVWYSYTNPSACPRTVTASMCAPGSATFNAVIHVFSGSCALPVLETCDDSSGACGEAEVTFTIPALATWLIAVSELGPGSGGGGFKMNVSSTTAVKTVFGASCPGTMVLDINLPPVLGSPRTVSITGAAANSVGLLLLSNPTGLFLPLGGGCTLYLDQGSIILFQFIFTDGSGNWSISGFVPASPECLAITLQGVVFPVTGIPSFQATNGLYLVFGV